MTDWQVSGILGFALGLMVGVSIAGRVAVAQPAPSPSPLPVRHCFALAANHLRHVKYMSGGECKLTFRADRMRDMMGSQAVWVYVYDGKTYRIGTPPISE